MSDVCSPMVGTGEDGSDIFRVLRATERMHS
jgi:hypothetical protein